MKNLSLKYCFLCLLLVAFALAVMPAELWQSSQESEKIVWVQDLDTEEDQSEEEEHLEDDHFLCAHSLSRSATLSHSAYQSGLLSDGNSLFIDVPSPPPQSS